MILQIPGDAFSDGQIRSKLWLAKNLDIWNEKYLNPNSSYTLNWFGSWVGLGPFLVLSMTQLKIKKLNLIELDADALRNSEKILEHWRIEGLNISYLKTDMNDFKADEVSNQLFINTSCEHVLSSAWLEQIPKNSFVLLQSTDMAHIEHINCPKDLADFKRMYDQHLEILDLQQIDFTYPGKSFSRFMLLGRKI